MKSLLYFFALILSSGIYAQSNYYQTVMDNSDGDAIYLEKSPWDQSKLIQITRVFDQNSNSLVYDLFEVSSSVSSPVVVPSCSVITDKPTVLDDGMLITGETSSGVQCMFFDGISTTVYDLNLGTGNNNPTVHVLEDRIFIIASNFGTEQLYEFDKVAHTVQSLTYGTSSVFEVCAIWDDALFFSTRDYNSTTSQFDYSLIKLDVSGSFPSSSIIRTISVDMNPAKRVHWSFPQIKWGKLYLTEDILSAVSSAASDLRIISIDQNDQVDEVHQDLQADNIISQLFEWDDALWTYGGNRTQLFKSTDGVSFSQELDLGSKSISDHHISENNKFYLIMNTASASVDEISAYDGTVQTIGTGKILRFLREDNDVVYLSDHNIPDSTSIVLLNTNYDVLDVIKIAYAPFPIRAEATIMFENEFNFIMIFGQADADILKLTGSPSAGADELEIEMSTFPNPINAGDVLEMRALRDGEVELMSTSGNVLKRLEIINGEAHLDTSFLSSGVYFISFGNHTQRIVVN
ncbi:MAG: T9SS type A sorting domain-containing protein [Crocinitomicaceae bacterium]